MKISKRVIAVFVVFALAAPTMFVNVERGHRGITVSVQAASPWIGYVKPAFPDYAPSGVPDFDEKQDNWGPGVGIYTWCGPVAVANSLWWLDSEYESNMTINPVPPPTSSDHFPLVTSYSSWDDHDPRNVDPLVRNLALLMDTDDGHMGTRWQDLENGTEYYLKQQGVSNYFEVHNSSFPGFGWISSEILKCPDVVLFLEFYQLTGSGWVPLTYPPSLEAGHFVTCAGVNITTSEVLISDPYQDAYEAATAPGRSPILHGYPHNSTIHNNASYVSQDAYQTANYTFIGNPPPPPPPNPPPGYPPVALELKGYLQTMGFDATWHTFIRASVATSLKEVQVPAMYWKPGYPDYAPSGMTDFDERQWGTYNWSDPIFGAWSHCAPVAEANSLWWLDSEFESGSIPPPTESDSFNLVTSYNATWDDHDPRNVPYLIEHLAYLMDTDGRRTSPPLLPHTGTNVTDMETGLAQYLSWAGVNPIGDVNGDGVVNTADLAIVVAANATIPGMPGWNMAADIYPATLGWPTQGKADNVVNQSDINLVTANMNKTGMFTERTVPAPDFSFIEKEVEKCEDVVITIAFWTFTGAGWSRENYTNPYPNTGTFGHALTVAGVNSTTLKIAISDPAFDNFEAGGEGRSPVPHMHSPPEPPYTAHNDASLVSQDAYNVTWISPPWPPCPGGNWTIVGYDGCGPMPPQPGQIYAIIENAVVVSPVHDVAVTNVTSPKTIICQGYTGNVTITVENHGGYTETFNVTAYANHTATGNTTSIGAFINVTLVSEASTSLVSVWNTTGFAKGNYTLSAYAKPVLYETHVEDNNFTDRWIIVSMVGDITGAPGVPWPGLPDGKVDGKDVTLIAKCFGSFPGCLPPMTWVPNADINNDGKVDGKDTTAVAKHFGQYDP